MGETLTPRDPARATDTPRREAADSARRGGADESARRLHARSRPASGPRRERVRVHAHDYQLSGDEVRALATVGAFRVVPANDLRDRTAGADTSATGPRAPARPRAHPDHAVCRGPNENDARDAHDRGRDVLESHRRGAPASLSDLLRGREQEPGAVARCAGLSRVYAGGGEAAGAGRASAGRPRLRAEERVSAFLQSAQQGPSDSDGRPERDPREIREWAQEHELPIVNDGASSSRTSGSSTNIRDGRRDVEDVEVTTAHYRGAHAAGKAPSGFTRFRASARVGGAPAAVEAVGAVDPRLPRSTL